MQETPQDILKDLNEKSALDKAEGFFSVYEIFRPLCNLIIINNANSANGFIR